MIYLYLYNSKLILIKTYEHNNKCDIISSFNVKNELRAIHKMISYSISFDDVGNIGSKNVTKYSNSIYLFEYPCISNTRCVPYEAVLSRGKYKIECWGASGGLDSFKSGYGRGAYVSGVLTLNASTRFFLYIGGKGSDYDKHREINGGGYNGGGNGKHSASGGGGGTDVRLARDKYASRIIVAGGGAGGERVANGHGGALSGIAGQSYNCGTSEHSLTRGSLPGTQTEGGQGGGIEDYGYGTSGSFGVGGDGYSQDDSGPGGGGGYFGGGGTTWVCSGSGGSSYISGMNGCFSVPDEDKEQTLNNSIHYSNLYFTEPLMIPGNNPMPSHLISSNGLENIVPDGNIGNGAIRITILRNHIITCGKKHSLIKLHCFVFLSMLLKR